MQKGESYEMSAEEIEAVNDRLAQLANGQLISNEESNKRVNEWLKNCR